MNDAYCDDVLTGNGATEAQKHKRETEFRIWFERFASGLKTIRPGDPVVVFAKDAAALVNHTYWELMDERVRPRITPCTGTEVRADRHKIASLTELVIAFHQPIEHVNEANGRRLNAALAYFCALNIIGNWNKTKTEKLHVSDSFSKEHLAWLEHVTTSSESMPVFSNAATWYLVELLYRERHSEI